ncbi:hypothetical protein T459_04914 [Capsicum annuum]|uniref:Retrotransposon gag domain-containing protein n=1 Tax=Capsicum annuum TaxID=4072 RepID=A0A2G3A6I3_CAPAN|nr:hypothetical protein T459_04914 [Capsicum annuum]
MTSMISRQPYDSLSKEALALTRVLELRNSFDNFYDVVSSGLRQALLNLEPHHIRKMAEQPLWYEVNDDDDMDESAIRLRMFPLSLYGEATLWLNELTPDCITNWTQLRGAFLERAFNSVIKPIVDNIAGASFFALSFKDAADILNRMTKLSRAWYTNDFVVSSPTIPIRINDEQNKRDKEKDKDMAHPKSQMDLIAKYLLSGKMEKGISGTLLDQTIQDQKTNCSCLAITTRSGKILSSLSVGKSLNNEEVTEEPTEKHPEKSKKPNNSVDISDKEKEEEVVLKPIPRPPPPFP